MRPEELAGTSWGIPETLAGCDFLLLLPGLLSLSLTRGLPWDEGLGVGFPCVGAGK